jgi:hypothetical protein
VIAVLETKPEDVQTFSAEFFTQEDLVRARASTVSNARRDAAVMRSYIVMLTRSRPSSAASPYALPPTRMPQEPQVRESMEVTTFK